MILMEYKSKQKLIEKNKNQIYFPDDELSLDFIYKRKGICKFVDQTTNIEENKNNYQE